MASALRGVGNFKPGMVVQTATVIINIVLAPMLIFGWGTGRPMGVAGAAIASLIAVAIGVVWLATYFFGREGYLRFVARDLKPQFPLWRDMLKIGLPAGAEFALMAVYLMLVYVLARPFGAAAQAGFGIGMRVVQALFMPVVALGLRGGAGGRPERRRPARRARQGGVQGREPDGGGLDAADGGRSATSPRRRSSRVFSDDPAVIAVGDEYLRIVAVELRRVGADLRVLEHVPGDGQHHAVAHRVGHAHRRDCRARDRCSRRCPASSCAGSGTCRSAPSCCSSRIVLLFLRREFRLRLDSMPPPVMAQPVADSVSV